MGDAQITTLSFASALALGQRATLNSNLGVSVSRDRR